MTTSEHLRAVAYVDGGCVPNPGRGAWAAVVILCLTARREAQRVRAA